jgi:hypothetical protein
LRAPQKGVPARQIDAEPYSHRSPLSAPHT